MKTLELILVGYLASLTFAYGGGVLWTRQVYEQAYQESTVVFKARVIEQKRQYFHDGKKIDVPERSSISEYFKEGGKLPKIHTTVVLEITSVEKGDSLKVGQKVSVNWKDSAFILCPHPENVSLRGEEKKWHDVGQTYKIFPDKLYKLEGDNYVEDKD
jgi:hypothetical protein